MDEAEAAKRERRTFAFVVCMSALLLLGIVTWCWRPNGIEDADTSVYLAGAKSLAEGHGYHFPAHANTPRITIVPPLHSAYIAVWWKLFPSFPQNMDGPYLGMILLSLASFALVLRYWRREKIPDWAAIATVVVWGASWYWLGVIYCFLSDILFGLFWLLLAIHWRSEEATKTPRWWTLTSLLMVMMFLTRTAALAPMLAIGGLACFSGKNKQRNLLLYSLPVGATLIAWKAWTASNQNYATLMTFFQEGEGGWLKLAKLSLSNLSTYLSGQSFLLGLCPSLAEQATMPGRFNSIGGLALVISIQAIGFAWMIFWTYGVFKLGSRNEKWMAMVVVAYLIEVGLWPYDFSARGGYAVFPILLPWARRGGAALLSRFQIARAGRLGLAPLAFACFAANLHHVQVTIDPWQQRLSRLDELREVAEWTRTNTPPNAVIAATYKLPTLYFHEFSQRQLVPDYFRNTATWQPVSHAAQNFLEADYILVSREWSLDVPTNEWNKFPLMKSSSLHTYRLHRVVKQSVASNAH